MTVIIDAKETQHKCIGCGKRVSPKTDILSFLPRGYVCLGCLDYLFGKDSNAFYGGA